MTQPARSREEYDVKIKNAEAAGDKGAVIELTRRRDEKFPAPAGESARPTGETGQPGQPDTRAFRPVQWGMLEDATDTMTAGLGSKAVAAGMGVVESTLPGSDISYSQAYDDYRSRQEEGRQKYRTEHPDASVAARGIGLAGSLGPFVGKTAIGAGGQVLEHLPGMGAGSAIPTSAAIGGVTAATDPAKDFTDRLIHAARGTAIGTAVGVAAPYVGRAAGWTYDAARRLFSGRGVPEDSVELIVRELDRQGITPAMAQTALQRMGPEGMIADVGPGAQQMTAATGAVEPGAAQIITPALRNRRLAAPGRTRGYLDQAMGPARDPFTVQQTTRNDLDAISPEYTAATANAPPLPRNLDDLMAQGLTFPMADMSLASRRSLAPYFDQIDDALGADTPSMVVSRLHDIRMGLDAQLRGTPLTNADRASRRALQNVRNLVDDVLKNRVPGWREADEAYAPINRQQEAFEQGRTEVMRAGPSTMTPAELRHHYRQSTPEVNDMRTQGMRAELERQTNNEGRNAALTVDRTLNRDFNDQKLGIQIGQTRADRLAQQLDTEGTFLETSNAAELGRGSRTAPLSETAQRLYGREPGALADAATAGGTAAATTGSLTVGAATAGAVVARRAIANAGARLSRPATDLIIETAQNLTATGTRRDMLVQALVDEAAAMPLRAQSRANVEQLVRALMTAQGTPKADEEVGSFIEKYGSQ